MLEAFNINITGFDPARASARELKLSPAARFTQAALGEDMKRIRDALISKATSRRASTSRDVRLDSATNRITVTLDGQRRAEGRRQSRGYELSEKKRARDAARRARGHALTTSAIVEGARRLRNRVQETGYFFAEVTTACTVAPPLARRRADASTLSARRGARRRADCSTPKSSRNSQRHHRLQRRAGSPLRAHRDPHRGHGQGVASRTCRRRAPDARPRTCSASSLCSATGAATRARRRWSATARTIARA